MKRIELFCERKKAWRDKAADILANEDIQGASFTETTGIWERQLERSFKIDVVGSILTEVKARRLAQALAQRFAQQAVLYTFTNDDGKLSAKLVQQDGSPAGEL
jgi:hypothetical protein